MLRYNMAAICLEPQALIITDGVPAFAPPTMDSQIMPLCESHHS